MSLRRNCGYIIVGKHMEKRKSIKESNAEFKNHLTVYLPIFTILIIVILYYFSQTYSDKWNYNWSGIRLEIKDTILEFDKYGVITSNATGYSGETPQQWHRQNWILKNATTSELEKLIDFPSGIVKGIAYVGVLHRTKNKRDLLNKSLNDTLSFVFYQSGCVSRDFLLSEYLNIILNIENYQPCCSIKLTESERNEFLGKLKNLKSKKEYYKKEFYKRIK